MENLDKGPFDLALVNFDVASKREEWKTDEESSFNCHRKGSNADYSAIFPS